MKLPTEVFGDVVVVHTPEELGDDHTPAFGAFLDGLRQSKVVLDIDGTESIDSFGLESLLDAQDKLREAGGDVKISTTNHFNRKILEITRLDDHVEVFDSVIDAVKSFA